MEFFLIKISLQFTNKALQIIFSSKKLKKLFEKNIK
jgi:hypothetical protein